ncbi:MAG: hypothetical protein KGL39_14925 [Patescibacteria group bacterium]|nr:hypothetical protein [Patescibacteria group bacterium]
MAIKLYIFYSVEDAARFEQAMIPAVGAVSVFEPGVADDLAKINAAERNGERPAPRRTKRKAAKEAFRERILAKAKANRIPEGRRKCGKCGEVGHRATTCPNGGFKVKEVESFDSYEEEKS